MHKKNQKKTKSRQQADQRVHLHSYTRTNAWTTQKHNNVVAHWMDGAANSLWHHEERLIHLALNSKQNLQLQ